MPDVIQLEKLTKTYGRRRGLRDLDLSVAEGEVFGYLGPNGAGKSTTIRVLLDLIRPTSGRALVFGHDPRRDAVALHRRIGYVAGEFVVNPRQRVGECLTFLADLRGGVPNTPTSLGLSVLVVGSAGAGLGCSSPDRPVQDVLRR
ncbi:ATP-binding cassette domain-containing protein [Micromonospora aurantiaca]|uniref:ATP-binding cassette domain-containing protein n=1 Tax=Micromonospora aurantiaca (nom. illeg.) TaxID=47850 RepID=UPI001E45F39E|nr:ATP-binding cassette domain-containing protein [Micromonospora aurantiaca]UFN96835.1 ATP-binding cassette domain-containing protein [Micromonospora aurantiaca]